MSIVDPEIIKKWEKELFSSILTSIDMHKINKLFAENYSLKLLEKPEFTNGEIVVHQNQIAYKLGFCTMVSFSLLLDKLGSFKGFTTLDDTFLLDAGRNDSDNHIVDFEIIRIKETEFLYTIAANISNRSISELFYKLYKLKVSGDIIYKHGDTVVFNGHVTYQLAFEVEVNFSLFIDKNGKYIVALQEIDGENSTTEEIMEEKITQSDSESLDNFLES
jgi:hypothetical protein